MQRGHAPSLERARALVMAGLVRVSDERASSSAQLINAQAGVSVVASERFVSRGAWKLEGALNHFAIDVRGLVCADVGAATGGFSDVLLQRDAERVYAVDVGYGDLDWKVRSNPRLIPIERTNARHLESLPERVTLVVIDASFISLTMLVPSVVRWLTQDGMIVALVKPQFEVDRAQVPEGGVVEDRALHRIVIERVAQCALEHGLSSQGITPSALKGSRGNQEYLLWLKLGGKGDITQQLSEIFEDR